jgi:hypothetical protein
MNALNAKLEITSVLPVEGTTDQWNIIAAFIDNTGAYYGTDVIVGDIIFIDGTPFNLGILRYRVSEVDLIQSDLYNLYTKIQWDSYAAVNEPYSGLESCIGRIIFGSVFLPSSVIQFVSQSFIDYIRNGENSRVSQVSLINRTYNGPYFGDRDGFNQVFQVQDPFVPGTLDVFVNGILMNEGIAGIDPNDYILVAADQVSFTLTPGATDIITFNYNKK